MAIQLRSAAATRQSGAALLILITVVGLGAAGLVMTAMGRAQLNAARERNTLILLGQAKDALLGFALLHGRLPRPALSAIDGKEAPTPCASEESCNGFIPWVALGISGSDSWGKLIRYSVTPAFTTAPILALAAVPTKTVIGRQTDGSAFYLVGQANCAGTPSCAPAVIFSNGKENLGTAANGVALANSSLTNRDELHNGTGSNAFVSRAATDQAGLPGGEFDDLVTWIPTKLLFSRMRAAGVLP